MRREATTPCPFGFGGGYGFLVVVMVLIVVMILIVGMVLVLVRFNQEHKSTVAHVHGGEVVANILRGVP